MCWDAGFYQLAASADETTAVHVRSLSPVDSFGYIVGMFDDFDSWQLDDP